MLIKIMKSEEGSGLVLSLMVLLVLSVLGSALGVVTVGSYQLGDVNQDSNSAYYIAEAGANMAYEEIKNKVIDEYNDSENSTLFFEKMDKPFAKSNTVTFSEEFKTQFGNQPIARVELTGNLPKDNIKEYIIKSTGEIAGKTRTVEKTFTIEWVDKNSGENGMDIPIPKNKASIVFKSSLSVGTNPKVHGNVVRHSTGTFPNNFKPIEGNIIVDDNYPWDDYKIDSNISSIIPDFYEPNDLNHIDDYGTDGTLTIIENSYLPELVVNNHNTLTVDTKGKNVDLLVNKINIDNGKIKVINGGSLRVFYNGKTPINFQNSIELDATIISQEADINFNGNEAKVTGDIIAGAPIKLANRPTVTGNIISISSITADNATIIGDIIAGGDVTMTNSGTSITGNVFSKGTMSFDNATVDGIIISEKSIEFKNVNNIKPLVIAPNGKVSFGSNAKVMGSIIAKNVSLGNDNEVKYDELLHDYIPDTNTSGEEINIEDLISAFPAIEQ